MHLKVNSQQFLPKPIPLTKHRWDEYTIPFVSIACITFNHEKFIRDAIEGFLRQETTFPVEVLIHDDVSTDRTAEILREYEQRFPNLILPIYQKENQYSQGINPYIKFLFPRARGKYIAICEGDDYWTDPQKLHKQVKIFLNHPDTIICGARAKTWNENKQEFTFITPELDKDISCMTPKQFFSLGSWVKACTRMVPRELMSNIPMKYSVDYMHVHYLLAKNPTGTFRCLDEVVAVYREHARGVFSGADPIDVQKEYFESTTLIAKLFEDERASRMRKRALQTAKALSLNSSLELKERVFYALQYFVLTLRNFSYLEMKQAFKRLSHQVYRFLEDFPAIKAFLRTLYRFVKRTDGRDAKN